MKNNNEEPKNNKKPISQDKPFTELTDAEKIAQAIDEHSDALDKLAKR